ncbi:hypothetical protein MED121_22217 [Marinomonas sp. MED121]|uniref:DUF3426 domain-containing protein n=1 Tax=Marinomonas sp. MED121 TaxID=314277 RepID=UPI000068FDB1|nr:DUF3426 domain-containing protein [Marinomonas sp. MED121]EAQ65433.1 hypothetical protein MED121_22217 [Marinomonas sp. MED121]
MPDSMITQCPKCSTAFRVSEDVLSMAKGKVRCGQCFHIFEAKSHVSQANDSTPKKNTHSHKEHKKTPAKQTAATKEHSPNLFTAADDDDIVNPDWLNTLISDDDLAPLDTKNQEANLNPHARVALEHAENHQPKTSKTKTDTRQADKEPAPWEVELAELEAAQQQTKKKAVNDTQKKPVKPPIDFTEENVFLDSKTLTQPTLAQTTKSENEKQASAQPEPEYMQALQELAQSVSQQPTASTSQGLDFSQDVSHSLGELMDDPEDNVDAKPKHTWRWALASFIFLIIAGIQFLVINYEEGSRSASLRPIYNTVCSYYGCTLPIFEDVSSIDIQHVRVQSHPTRESALVVNAIMTNHSDFSQPMPKIAMEFYDLNGNPVAARLFSQQDFLDKDFLDITYMPPKTPIHLVIPIADPGASAVTHKLKVYRAETRSY